MTLEPVDRIALTGRNGSGKSTLLRILAGLEAADAGQLSHGGAVVDATALPGSYPRSWRRRVAYLHQHPFMFRGSVHFNAAYGLRAMGLWSAESEAQVAGMLEWAGLGSTGAQPAHWLSGGERQRLALARALLLEPEWLLLDEPTSNLDGEAREKVLALIDELMRQQRGLVVVTHDRDLLHARDFRRLKLADGRLLERD